MKSIILLFLSLTFCPSVLAKGVSVQFAIQENFLICHMLYKKSSSPETKKLQNDLAKLFPDEIALIKGQEELLPSWIETEKSLVELIRAGKKHPRYHKLLEETKVHLLDTEAEWKKNYDNSYKRMKFLTKLDLVKDFIVLITHPESHQGRYLGNNLIGWGRTSEWPNYSTVYLWHEILHSYLQFNDWSHALIELLTDEDLRTHLNAGLYPPFSTDGHPRLVQNKTLIYEMYWADYLKNSEMDVLELEKKILSERKKGH